MTVCIAHCVYLHWSLWQLFWKKHKVMWISLIMCFFFILGLFNMNFSALKCIDCFLLPPKSKKQIVSSSCAQLNLKKRFWALYSTCWRVGKATTHSPQTALISSSLEWIQYKHYDHIADDTFLVFLFWDLGSCVYTANNPAHKGNLLCGAFSSSDVQERSKSITMSDTRNTNQPIAACVSICVRTLIGSLVLTSQTSGDLSNKSCETRTLSVLARLLL